MLQQTQVDRVIPYFDRWMKKFPTPEKLARAKLVDVLREWSGLGYNRRAKFLHNSAKEIVAKHGGKVPQDFAALLALPGVGDYTAKAVRVFAHNEPEVLIETNVRAVFLHHFFSYGKARKTLRSFSEAGPLIHDKQLLPLISHALKDQDPRTFYAALMDYGSHLKALHPNPSRRSKHHTKQSKFEGSLRQVRGAILRAHARGENITDLRSPYIERFDEALASLVRDGLVKGHTRSDTTRSVRHDSRAR
jgi:A/G-specific adenine glycosylase